VASLKVDDVVQFERVGFARIDHVSKARSGRSSRIVEERRITFLRSRSSCVAKVPSW